MYLYFNLGSYLCQHTLTVDACTRYPGTTATFSSNGTSILVMFVSDATVGFTGFKLKFTSVSTSTTAATTSADDSSGNTFYYINATKILRFPTAGNSHSRNINVITIKTVS